MKAIEQIIAELTFEDIKHSSDMRDIWEHPGLGPEVAKILLRDFGGGRLYLKQATSYTRPLLKVVSKIGDRDDRRDFAKELGLTTAYIEKLYKQSLGGGR